MEVSGQLQAPAALLSGTQSTASIVQEAGWAPEPVWTFWRKENLFSLLGLPARSLVAIPTGLFRLLFVRSPTLNDFQMPVMGKLVI
jgi:hypothetical protein